MECKIKKILSNTWIPDECLKAFEGIFEFAYPKKDADDFSYQRVVDMVESFDALFVTKDFMCGRQVLDAGTNLKAIASHGIGYNNIDSEYATERGIFVLNTPIGFCEATADFSVSLIMSVIRGVAWYDKEFNNTKSEVIDSMNTKNTFLYGKTLGIIGFGGIGKAVARKALGFGMKIIYHDIVRSSIDEEEDLFASFVDFDELLKTADIVTCHIPTQEGGKYLINIDAFQKMKDTAYFVNASHGRVVSEFDLLEALRKKEIRAAAIDIHEFESKISEDIASLENVVIAPNIAVVAYESRVNMCLEIFGSMRVLSEGKFPHNIVNNKLCEMLLNPQAEEDEEPSGMYLGDGSVASDVEGVAEANEIGGESMGQITEPTTDEAIGTKLNAEDTYIEDVNTEVDAVLADDISNSDNAILQQVGNADEFEAPDNSVDEIQALVDNVSKSVRIDRTPLEIKEDIDMEVDTILADEADLHTQKQASSEPVVGEAIEQTLPPQADDVEPSEKQGK